MMDDQAHNRWVSVYLDNGFRMWVLIYNSGSEKGTSAGGLPPLGVPDLEKVATSPLWFGYAAAPPQVGGASHGAEDAGDGSRRP